MPTPNTEQVYTAGQFTEVLRATLYAEDAFSREVIRVTTSHVTDDTLVVTIINGQQFALVAHQMVAAGMGVAS